MGQRKNITIQIRKYIKLDKKTITINLLESKFKPVEEKNLKSGSFAKEILKGRKLTI